MKKGKNFHIISFNTNAFKSKIADLDKDSKYDLAETVFHEMEAHIELAKPGSTPEADHDAYGRIHSGINNSDPIKEGSPADIIAKELREVRKSDIKHDEEEKIKLENKKSGVDPHLKGEGGDGCY